MKRSRFTDEQITSLLKEHEAGMPISEFCRVATVMTLASEDAKSSRFFPKTHAKATEYY